MDLKEHQFILYVVNEINILNFLTYTILGDRMDKQDKLLDKVSMKTHVSKQDILALANDLQTKDLNDEKNIRDFVLKVSHLTNKEVRPEQMEKIISVIQNNQIPKDIDKLV